MHYNEQFKLHAGEDDVMDVMEEVVSIKSVWFNLGKWLRLRKEDLEGISQSCPNESDHDKALEEVLLLWLQQKYNVEKFGPPTWKMLVEAVDKKTGGNDHSLAKEIALKYPSGVLTI